MSKGTRSQSAVEEWAKLINAPKENEDDLDVYAKKKKDHNTMAHMYKEIPDAALETQVSISTLPSVRLANNQLDPQAHSLAKVR